MLTRVDGLGKWVGAGGAGIQLFVLCAGILWFLKTVLSTRQCAHGPVYMLARTQTHPHLNYLYR